MPRATRAGAWPSAGAADVPEEQSIPLRRKTGQQPPSRQLPSRQLPSRRRTEQSAAAMEIEAEAPAPPEAVPQPPGREPDGRVRDAGAGSWVEAARPAESSEQAIAKPSPAKRRGKPQRLSIGALEPHVVNVDATPPMGPTPEAPWKPEWWVEAEDDHRAAELLYTLFGGTVVRRCASLARTLPP